jgi:hypothetical protein
VNTRPSVRSDLSRWWEEHDQGTGGRPEPGTRVVLRDGRPGTVTAYEGCWRSCTFPVLIDGTGQSLMLSPLDVTEPATGGKPAGVVEGSRERRGR